MRIRIVNPVVKQLLGDDVLPPLPDYVTAELDWLEDGPSSIESRCDHALCVPPLLERVKAAAAEGVDGIVLNCFMDTGLEPARELVAIPVAGPAQSAMTLAITIAERFSVILPARSGAPIVVDQAIRYVGRERLASVRSVEMPVSALHYRDRLAVCLVQEAERAVSEDGAHAVVLGCTGMSAVTHRVRQGLRSRNFEVPVIDPTAAAVAAVASQLAVGVHHSGRTYAVPSWKAAAIG